MRSGCGSSNRGEHLSTVEIVVFITPLRPALQNLGRVMARFARSRSLGRIAADVRLKFHEVGEDIGLPPQLIGNHWRLARNGRDHRDADAPALYRLYQRAEVAVTRK